jgi:hypothetical protein
MDFTKVSPAIYIERKKGTVDIANFRRFGKGEMMVCLRSKLIQSGTERLLYLSFRSFFQPTWPCQAKLCCF